MEKKNLNQNKPTLALGNWYKNFMDTPHVTSL